MDANGNYLVTWQSSHQDGYSWGIYGHAYDAQGNPTSNAQLGNEFLVNNVIQQGPQTASAISMLPTGPSSPARLRGTISPPRPARAASSCSAW
jgi:hypothetical protein